MDYNNEQNFKDAVKMYKRMKKAWIGKSKYNSNMPQDIEFYNTVGQSLLGLGYDEFVSIEDEVYNEEIKYHYLCDIINNKSSEFDNDGNKLIRRIIDIHKVQ
ncbi:hypothetical protein MXM59_03760 [Mammaliicoccus sciuri]|uniref:hypothetical protein n=1 Tax=Mammaliicoccus sciuri TaxID=1296 RepID=UPI002DB96D40|nr:hypothetical protein [Mammaliicoccus sciuri]MEB6226326.1 hypothetical protein [Mammaliicoccus sciuri]